MRWKRRAAGAAFKWLLKDMARKRRETTDTDTRHYTDYPTGADFLFFKKQEKSAQKPFPSPTRLYLSAC